MLELIILIVVAYLAYNAGCMVTSWRLRDLIFKEAKERGLLTPEEKKLLEKEQTPTISTLWIEKLNDVLYLYDYNQNTFVCQASSIDELASLAFSYKQIKYAAVVVDNKTIMFVDGKVKQMS